MLYKPEINILMNVNYVWGLDSVVDTAHACQVQIRFRACGRVVVARPGSPVSSTTYGHIVKLSVQLMKNNVQFLATRVT